MKNWDELRTAYEVAKHGTVTAAADALQMHRATVQRHIDNLEAELGAKVFQRHGRGYTPTDIGRYLLRAASVAEAEFSQLQARAQGHNELQGEFIITSLDLVVPLIYPAIRRFQQQYPKLNIHYVTGEDRLFLEYGQAHVAIRSGAKPDHPDYVVKPFTPMKTGLFAHRDYVAKYGKPTSPEELSQHDFIKVSDDAGFAATPINEWLNPQLDDTRIVLQSNSYAVRENAIRSGIGIGVMYNIVAEQHPDLVEVYPPHSDWYLENWLVTHGDLHRSEKVQRFLQLLGDRWLNV